MVVGAIVGVEVDVDTRVGVSVAATVGGGGGVGRPQPDWIRDTVVSNKKAMNAFKVRVLRIELFVSAVFIFDLLMKWGERIH